MKQNPTTLIKCTFSNAVNKLLDRKFGVKISDRWKHKLPELTDAEKIALFDEISKLHEDSTKLISSYNYDKRKKKRVLNARIERGFVPKDKQVKMQKSA